VYKKSYGNLADGLLNDDLM